MRSMVIAVPTTKQRDQIIKVVKSKFQIMAVEEPAYHVVQDRVHRIQVWKNNVLEQQVTVVVVPVHMNTEQLLGYSGSTRIHTDYVRDELLRMIRKLEELKVTPQTDADTTDKLLGSL